MSDVTVAGAKKQFRNDTRGNDTPEAIRLMEHPDSTEEIPVIDMTPYLKGEPGGRENVAAQLKDVTETIGFFYLAGHGIPQTLMDEMFVQAKRFHGLPEAEKMKVAVVLTDGFKMGYEPILEKRLDTNAQIIQTARPNFYARFKWRWERPDAKKSVNLWPENLAGFRETLIDYQNRIAALGHSFLPLWAVSLGLSPDHFAPFFQPNIHLMTSLLHYPPQKEVGNQLYGIAPHTDNSLMTFLLQGTVPGLAVRMPSGHWRKVEYKPGMLLINTGNTMVRWTNDRYLSTKHRVINTGAVERYSIPAFFGPDPDAMIACLPTCQSAERPAQYEAMTYRDLRKWYYKY